MSKPKLTFDEFRELDNELWRAELIPLLRKEAVKVLLYGFFAGILLGFILNLLLIWLIFKTVTK